jgi:hypothetical protein
MINNYLQKSKSLPPFLFLEWGDGRGVLVP